MSDIGDLYSALRKQSQDKRTNNRMTSAHYLERENIAFTSHNNGAHLIVEGKECFIDFWPGTGKWKSRNGDSGFGVANLVKYIKE